MRIAIDPGHGGSDPGAIGPSKAEEKAVNLSVAKKLKANLEKYGVEVVMTRSDDTYISTTERANIANRAVADYFISIHCNSYVDPSANGTESYVYAKKGVTYAFASSVHQSLVQEIKLRDRGVKEASFTVLTKTNMPAVLVEIAFISNPNEEKLLIDGSFQDRVASSITTGICTYLGIPMGGDEHWGQPAIDKLLEMGLITEPKDPTAYVTWAEFATVLLRAMDYKQ